ncbi:MAG: hypothetical protein MJ025_03670 [Victivallaceae bacterium]|nr:hypothetical protein [Victivallaceae bacterium]
MKKLLAAAFAALLVSPLAAAGILDESELFRTPEVRSAERYKEYHVDGLDSLLLEALPAPDGSKCFVFAYFGLPDSPKPENGYPAVVLQHGNSDTCFPMIAKRWRDRGYAVISYDHYGNLPVASCNYLKRPVVEESLQAKMKTKGHSNDAALRETWAPNIRSCACHANTYMRSRPEIDRDRIFLVGVSHGALNGLIVAGADHRFAGYACCYGCGHLALGSEKTPYHARVKADPRFNPENFLSSISCPVLWVVGSNDFAFEQVCWQKSIDDTATTDNQAAIVGLDHGARAANYGIVYRWIDSKCGRDIPLPKLGKNTRNGNFVECSVLDPGAGIAEAKLCFSRDAVVTRDSKWETVDAKVDGNRISATLPDGATAFFFSAGDRDYNGEKMPVSSPFTMVR